MIFHFSLKINKVIKPNCKFSSNEGIYYKKQKKQKRGPKNQFHFLLNASLMGVIGQKNNRPQSENHLRSVSVSGMVVTSNLFMKDLEEIGNF